jgi:hypothetical protein
MTGKISKRERLRRLADWVIDPKGSQWKLNDVLPFPIRSGVFERMTQADIQKNCTDLENCNPIKDWQKFDAIWDRAAHDVLENTRKWQGQWWRRIYFHWGRFRWPKAKLPKSYLPEEQK